MLGGNSVVVGTRERAGHGLVSRVDAGRHRGDDARRTSSSRRAAPVVGVCARRRASAALRRSARTARSCCGIRRPSGRWRVLDGVAPASHAVRSRRRPTRSSRIGSGALHAAAPRTTRIRRSSWRTLFGKVWYEGYAQPEYVWQSTGATDDFEPKFSLVPLIFGTIKGTLYAMLFAVPLAVLAALYTSQFVRPDRSAPRSSRRSRSWRRCRASSSASWRACTWRRWSSGISSRVLLMLMLLPIFGTFGVLHLAAAAAAHRGPAAAGHGDLPDPAAAAPGAAGSRSQLGPTVETWLFGGDARSWLQSDARPDLRPAQLSGRRASRWASRSFRSSSRFPRTRSRACRRA